MSLFVRYFICIVDEDISHHFLEENFSNLKVLNQRHMFFFDCFNIFFILQSLRNKFRSLQFEMEFRLWVASKSVSNFNVVQYEHIEV